jgi:hypothetical protein
MCLRACLRQVVSELESFLYISGRKKQEEVKSTLIHVKWYQSKKISLLSVEDKKEIHHATKETG